MIGWVNIAGGLALLIGAAFLFVIDGPTFASILTLLAGVAVGASGLFTKLSRKRLDTAVGGELPVPSQALAIRILLGVAAAEVLVNRVAVPLLRPGPGVPPWWHTGLD